MASFIIDSHKLSYVTVGDIHVKPPIVFLHGIMGNKKNLAGFVTKLVAAVPRTSAVIIDLPNHGQSSKHWRPLTVEACARAIARFCSTINPNMIAGHSFGGKVALFACELIPSIERLYMLDCPVGPVDRVRALNQPQSFTAFDVMDVLERVPFPVSSRKALVDALTNLGMSNALALWMTTNLIDGTDGLYLNFDPADLRVLLHDFVALDCWPVLGRIHDRVVVHAVAAEHGERVRSEKDRFTKMVAERGTFEILKDAGHFVHVDNPDGLIDIFKKFHV